MAELTNQECVAFNNVDHATTVFTEHGEFIRSIIRYYVKNEAEAEDLFQDLFLFLISKPIPGNVENVQGFLYKIIYDMIKDVFRRIERYQARMYKYARDRGNMVEPRPENTLAQVEEAKRMFNLIEKRLPPKEAQAVTLRYRDRRNVAEVADRMGVKPRSVSRYVSVGLRKFRGVMDED
ncbi:MAG: RNA polymerase sigma factor [Planctomycetota bacterium]|jgi:RNA polymerase sigma factor (sigma-70 family)